VGAVLANATDQIMLITTGGVLVRTPVAGIREMGRATQGVTLISVDDGSMLSGVRRVVESDVDDEGDDPSVEGTTPDVNAAGTPDEAGSGS
jgi:DNA gyrase subunit A